MPQPVRKSPFFAVPLFLLLLASLPALAQGQRPAAAAPPVAKASPVARPQLVVGIVVDQMRQDFLYRYWDKYGDDGFKRLLREGFNFKNGHYNYAPTYTGPGHASVYTGTTPEVHGIIGNNWYQRETKHAIYCAEDNAVQTVGSTTKAGQMSPVNMRTSTITDELRLSTGMQAKVIGVALKDRGSILPAGHTATGAYWFDSQNGHWITSTYYAQQLPQWVQQFNARNLPDQYLSQTWNTLLPIEQYTESTADDVPWERPFAGQQRPVFPYNLAAIRSNTFGVLLATPFGNTITTEFALEAIRAEQLGKRNVTDFLALSYSSPDYIGHQFGPYSVEVQDNYLRLDREIATLLRFLDSHVGKDNVLVFLTADHGAARSPVHLASLRIPAGTTEAKAMADSLDLFLARRFPPGRRQQAGQLVESYINQQVYLDHALISSRGLNLREVQQATADFLLRQPNVTRTITADALTRTYWGSGLMGALSKGYSPRRSGDVIVVLEPEWYEGYGARPHTGTTHGSPYTYDTHVPILWYGWRVPVGESVHRVSITDIAPTLAAWLNISQPSGNTGEPLQEYMR
jgi:predicted AlkP superfamily pyrophosphatase or phosphodiesterase